jgi:glutamate dehydrogenase
VQERARTGRGLTRPELAVLLSYAKIALHHDLLESGVPDEPGLEPWLTGYFPAALRERFAGDIAKHSLRREIIALGLTNAVVNRGGPAMAVRLAEETQRTTADVAYAFLAAREVFELPALWTRIDALDGKAKGLAQLALYQATQDLVNAQTLWFLRNGSAMSDLPGTIARHRTGVAQLKGALASVLSARRQALLETEARRLADGSIPADLAADVAALDIVGLAPPITEIAEETRMPVADAARTYLAVGEHLRISDLAAKAGAIPTPDYYDRLAVAQALSQLATAQAAFTRDAIRSRDADGAEAWLARQGDRLGRVKVMLEGIAGEGTLTVSRLVVAAGQLGDLTEARAAAPSTSARTGRAGGRPRSAASGSLPARRPARQPRS